MTEKRSKNYVPPQGLPPVDGWPDVSPATGAEVDLPMGILISPKRLGAPAHETIHRLWLLREVLRAKHYRTFSWPQVINVMMDELAALGATFDDYNHLQRATRAGRKRGSRVNKWTRKLEPPREDWSDPCPPFPPTTPPPTE